MSFNSRYHSVPMTREQLVQKYTGSLAWMMTQRGAAAERGGSLSAAQDAGSSIPPARLQAQSSESATNHAPSELSSYQAALHRLGQDTKLHAVTRSVPTGNEKPPITWRGALVPSTCSDASDATQQTWESQCTPKCLLSGRSDIPQIAGGGLQVDWLMWKARYDGEDLFMCVSHMTMITNGQGNDDLVEAARQDVN